MQIRSSRFNLYLASALIMGLLSGCTSTPKEDRKPLSTLRLHLELTRPDTQATSGADAKIDPFAKTEVAEVYRAHKVPFTIDKTPFLTEAMVKEARIVDVPGGFALQVQFDTQGTWLLEEYTGSNHGRHIVVASQFFDPGQEKINAGRWLAAPQIHNKISDGLFTFTPDATREEADRIVLGLKHVADRLATGRDIKF
jgi:preprotein translocase subunit SecD